MEKIISHIYYDNLKNDWIIQSNEEHSEGVAELASNFAASFGMSTYGKILGLLHDKGKESKAFQQHIKKESGFAPDTKVFGDYNHAFVGAIIARNIYGSSFDNLIANQIYSHHTGLHDSDELNECLSKEISSEINQSVNKIVPTKLHFNIDPKNDFHHLCRMLYSCLVDADYLDTERFINKDNAKLRGIMSSLSELLPSLEEKLTSLKDSNNYSEVNVVRNQVQDRCREMANTPLGFYSLTVPTGGGKTLSSLLWAIKHAIYNGLKRIIIAIPYTSIVVQTSSILKSIFGNENVLEHHSGFDLENITDEELRKKMELATENWDYPIIVTTNVQLFESIFDNKPSICRKLHNIVNSVILLDEVQTLPISFLKPIVDSMKTYNKLFNVSFLFTTASQPILSGNITTNFPGIERIRELIPRNFNLHEKLRRVKINIDDDGKSYDDVVEMLSKHKRVLCIVNTRKDAKELYDRLPKEGITFHLSKMMCSEHIKETIEQIKHFLKDEDTIIRVVSTQLIEAGVDIDFPVVYRQEAGLDSILQAAGRCNREGKYELSTTYVFSLSKEHNLPKGYIQATNNARKNIVGNLDLFAPETMTEYFRQLYSRIDSFDKKDIAHYLYNPIDISFATAAKKFQLIEDVGKTVFVCWKDSATLIKELQKNGPTYGLMKKLNKYSVNINTTDFQRLKSIGIVSEILDNVFFVEYQEQYDEHIGLRIENYWDKEPLIK